MYTGTLYNISVGLGLLGSHRFFSVKSFEEDKF